MFQGLTGKNLHASPMLPEWTIISGTVNVQQGELVILLGWSHAGLLQSHLASLANEMENNIMTLQLEQVPSCDEVVSLPNARSNI